MKPRLERRVDELQIEVETKQVSDRPPDETALTILDRHFVSAIKALGLMEEIALEFAEEEGDEGLMDPETRSIIASYVSTLNQKVTSVSTILVSDQVAGTRHHIPHQPKPDPDTQPQAQRSRNTQPHPQRDLGFLS